MKPADPEALLSKLEKTGGTPFIFDNIDFTLGEGLAIGGADLGEMRREALEKLLALRGNLKREPASAPDFSAEKTEPKSARLVGVFSHISQLPSDLSALAAVAVPIEENFESLSLDIPLYVTLPRGIESERFILSRLKTAKEKGVEFAFCGNIAAVTLCLEAGITPWFDFSMNVFNSLSAAAAEKLGAGVITLSAEARYDMLNAIASPLPTAYIAYGRLPLMLTRNCPQKNGDGCKNCGGEITDRKGISFPIRCRGGYSEILNSRPIYLAERQDEFSADYAVLLFTTEQRDECEDIIYRYQNHLRPEGEYTRGLYYRGVE